MKPAEFRPAEKYDTNPYYDTAEWPGPGYVAVESLTATENKTYTAPSGKAYSPVTVNVSGGGGVEHSITCYAFDPETHDRISVDGNICSTVIDDGAYVPTETEVQTAYAGAVLCATTFIQDNVTYQPVGYSTESAAINELSGAEACFVMPDENCVVFYADIS